MNQLEWASQYFSKSIQNAIVSLKFCLNFKPIPNVISISHYSSVHVASIVIKMGKGGRGEGQLHVTPI